MAESRLIKVGSRVELLGKGLLGKVAFVGTTQFSKGTGKWIGIILDEPKGKNNGTVHGECYFTCKDNHGLFVRQSQLLVVGDDIEGSSELKPNMSATDANAATALVVHEDSKINIVDVHMKPKHRPFVSHLKPPTARETMHSAHFSGVTESLGPIFARVRDSVATQEETSLRGVDSFSKGLSKAKFTATASVLVKTEPIDEDFAVSQPVPQKSEIESLKSEIKDLRGKLTTLRVKRVNDKQQLVECERAKIQLKQLQEYKIKMQEAQMELQRQLQASKKEANDIQEAYERYKDEMMDIQETIEMVTLDKEMTEEKCESLQEEVVCLREKVEELTVNLQIIMEDLETSSPVGISHCHVKHLEQQNERMREAVIKIRDQWNSEKHEHQKTVKELEAVKAHETSLEKDKEKLQRDVTQLQEEVLELKEQVDAAQGAEEMVNQLSYKTLQQEEVVQKLEDEKADLEALCEMNDEINERTRETELELREQIDFANSRRLEALRRLDVAKETVVDYESTNRKYRQLVAQMKENIRALQDKGKEAAAVSAPVIEFDLKAKFAVVKATAKAIDLELRKLDVQQANQHVSYLCAFMPDSFLANGGDHDAILVLLFIRRMIEKCDLLTTQLREKADLPDILQREETVKTQQMDGYRFASDFIYTLSILHGLLNQYENALNVCDVNTFVKVGTLLPEILVFEKHVDAFIDLTRKDQLDESTSMESLERAISFLRHVYGVYLAGNSKRNCTTLMASWSRTLLAISDCVTFDLSALKSALQSGLRRSDTFILLDELEMINSDIQMSARKIRRRLPREETTDLRLDPLSFNDMVGIQLDQSVGGLDKVVRTLKLLSSSVSQQIAISADFLVQALVLYATDKQGLPVSKVEQLAQKAAEQVFGTSTVSALQQLRQCCTDARDEISQIASAMENGEYDFDGTTVKEPLAPVFIRANAVKAEYDYIRTTLESKEEELQELNRMHTLKVAELSECHLRLTLLEEKLQTTEKEQEAIQQNLQKNLDDANMLMQKKIKGYEEALDALQQDIYLLEADNEKLKQSLKAQNIKSVNNEQGASNDKEFVFLQKQNESLQEALKFTLAENRRLKSAKMTKLLEELPPLKLPKPKETDDKNEQLYRKLRSDCDNLLKELLPLLGSPNLVDVTNENAATGVSSRRKDNPFTHLTKRTSRLASLKCQFDELQDKVTKFLTANTPGARVRSDFGCFPTPAFAKLLHEQSQDKLQRIGVISIPCKPGEGCTIPLEVNQKQLADIHQYFTKGF